MSQDLATKIAEWQQTDLLNTETPENLTDEEWDAYEDELRRHMIAYFHTPRKDRVNK